MTAVSSVRWNNNIHYHRLILDAVPAGAQNAIDVGTGNGLLAAELRQRVPNVTGLDSDSAVLESARGEDPGVTWIHGDLMTHPLALGSFDVVASVATLHHFSDLDLVLARLAELTAPGGVVAVVGLAKSSSPIDFAYDVAGFFLQGWYKRRHGMWEHSAPTVWPPPHTYADVRRSADRVLPGAHWHRLAMWRYALIWSKPTAPLSGQG